MAMAMAMVEHQPPLSNRGQMNRRYNDLMFHQVVCHVCKWLKDGATILCDCGMISYCCERHVQLDANNVEGKPKGHREICEVIKRLTREKRIRNFKKQKRRRKRKKRKRKKKRRKNEQQNRQQENPVAGPIIQPRLWYFYHMEYLRIIQRELGRKLEPHERLMLLDARSCCICHQETDLTPCPKCFHHHFCPAHSNSEPRRHQCRKWQAWLMMEIRSINVNPVPEWRTFHNFSDRSVTSIYTFYNEYMLPTPETPWSILDIAYSDYVSGPLTVYYGLRRAGILTNDEIRREGTYVVHIITTSKEDIVNLPAWELFLHYFSAKKKLKIIMVGLGLPEKLATVQNRTGTVTTCRERCHALGYELCFEYHRMKYCDYEISRFYIFPNVLVGFHGKFVGETWRQFVGSLPTPDIPLVLTARSKVNGRRYIKRIQSVLTRRTIPVINQRNPFAGCRLHRDYMNNRIFNRNQHLIVFQNLRYITSYISSYSSRAGCSSSAGRKEEQEKRRKGKKEKAEKKTEEKKETEEKEKTEEKKKKRRRKKEKTPDVFASLL